MRELNNAVFDAVVAGKGGVVRVGMGSSVYGFVGRWVPKGLVGWIMGLRKVGDEGKEFGRGKKMVLGESQGSRDTSPGSGGGLRYSAADLGMDESEYIAVYGEKGLEVEQE